MDKDITEEFEENVMSLVPETTTTTTQGNLSRGIVNWSVAAQSMVQRTTRFSNNFCFTLTFTTFQLLQTMHFLEKIINSYKKLQF